MTRLRLTLLGSFQALLDDRPIAAFESAKARALLAYLAVESDRAHRREALAELFWPERPPGAALANLRHTLANLRTAVGDHTATPPFLLITPQTIQFNRDSEAFVDLIHFAALLHDGAKSSLHACQEAMALYNGRLLEDFSLDDCPEFEAWLAVMRERIDRQVEQALARLVRRCVEQGDVAQAVQWSHRQLDLEPWNEDAHRQLMWLLVQGGQRAAALHQYDLCTQMLAAELGVAPQPITRTLAERIRSGESDLGAVSGLDGRPLVAAAVATRLAGVHHLPTETTPFVGRVHELAQILDSLASAECRLLTIVGPGGIGKTRLAVECSKALAPRFADGVWFIDLAPATVAALPAVLLQRLNAPETGSADARQRLMTYLAGKEMLLVLDNFEHLLEDAGLATELLAAAPAIKLLATSRASLRLQEEWLEPLTGMETPPPPAAVQIDLHSDRPELLEPAPDLGAYDATRLFLQCVHRLQPGFAPDDADARLIAQLCRQLEGMPLGIELTAAWMRSLPLSSLVDEAASGLPHLETPLRDVPARHRSMSAVFDQSWRLLSAHEQQVLRALSLFRGGFTQDAAARVAGAERIDLAHLIDASWLRLRPDGRYDMHELVRQYCAMRLNNDTESPERVEEIQRRHCAYYGEFLGGQVVRMNYDKDVMAAVMAEFGNLQTAWQWGVEHGEMGIAHDMAIGLFFIAEMLGWYHFVIQSYVPIIATLERVIEDSGGPAAQRKDAVVVLGWIEYARGCLCLQVGLVEEARCAVERCRAAGARLEEGDQRAEFFMVSRWLLSWTLLTTGEIDKARQIYEALCAELEAMTGEFTLYGSETGRKFWLAHVYAWLAMCARLQGNYAVAEARFFQAIALREEMGEQRFCAFNLMDYATTCVMMGKNSDALKLAQRGLAFSQAFGDQIGVAFGQMTLGIVAEAQGHYTVASAHLHHSLAMGRQSGNRELLVVSLLHLGRLALVAEQIDEAQAHFDEAMTAAIGEDALPYVYLADILIGFGEVALARLDWRTAARYFRQALRQAPRCAALHVQDAMFGLARVALAEGRSARAHNLLARVARHDATSAATRAAAKRQLQTLLQKATALAGDPEISHAIAVDSA
ncbi:MAG: BTAD domain-containing putative transcriptional regulator [Caldilinea sp.]